MNLIKTLYNKVAFNIEVLTHLLLVIASGWVYGIIEATWIPTNKLSLNILGMWSYYHVWLMLLMLFASFSLATSNVQYFLENKKKYVFFICIAALPLALMVEDISWFVTNGQAIARDEWTMMKPGLGVNFFSLTWIPLWYFISLGFAMTMLFMARKYAARAKMMYQIGSGQPMSEPLSLRFWKHLAATERDKND